MDKILIYRWRNKVQEVKRQLVLGEQIVKSLAKKEYRNQAQHLFYPHPKQLWPCSLALQQNLCSAQNTQYILPLSQRAENSLQDALAARV